MIDAYETNTQVLLLALLTVVPAVVSGVLVSWAKRTRRDRRFVAAGLAGIGASSLMFFGSAAILVTDYCCEPEMAGHGAEVGFFSSLRFLSTPFALVSACFFFRGLSERFSGRYIAEMSALLVLVWLMLFF